MLLSTFVMYLLGLLITSGHVLCHVQGVTMTQVVTTWMLMTSSRVEAIRCWIDTQGIPVDEADKIIAEFKVFN